MTTEQEEIYRRMIRHAASTLLVDSRDPGADVMVLAKRMQQAGELVLAEMVARAALCAEVAASTTVAR